MIALQSMLERVSPRLLPGLSFEAYKKMVGANASLLKKDTPCEMLHQINEPDLPTPAMMDGTLTHHCVLEPEVFATDAWKSHYQLFTATKGLGTKAAKEAMASDSRALISQEMLDTAKRSRDAVWAHKEASRLLLDPGKSEVSAQAWDADLQCVRKCRFDRLPDSMDTGIVDLKTTSAGLSDSSIRRDVFKYGYDVQLAFYQDTLAMIEGTMRERVYAIFVTKSAPFMCRVVEFTGAEPEVCFLKRGRDIYLERLAKFLISILENSFEAYENEGARLLKI